MSKAKTWAAFNWEDPFLIDEQLSEDERLIRDTARQYAQEKLQPRVAEAYLEEKTERGIFGTLVIDAIARNGGQPITLQGDGNSAWISRATLRTLKAWSSVPGLRMTLRILADEFEVVFDHGDAEETRAIAMQSVIEYSDPEDSDYYCSLVLCFIEVSETL